MALFTLGCRNGHAVLGTLDVVELITVKVTPAARALLGSSCEMSELRCNAAARLMFMMLLVKVAPKSSLDVRSQLEPGLVNALTSHLKSFASVKADVGQILAAAAKLFNDSDLSLACGAVALMSNLAVVSTQFSWVDAGLFTAALKVYSRGMPSPLPASWWLSTCDVVDVTSVRASMACVESFSLMKRLPQYTQLSTWSNWLHIAIDMVKMNAEAGLSARATMPYFLIYRSLGLVEAAAKCESHHGVLLDSGVADALEYACLNDFSFFGATLSAPAAGAIVALLGRNEGGKTLSREAVSAVLDSVSVCFDKSRYQMGQPMPYIVTHFARVEQTGHVAVSEPRRTGASVVPAP